MVIAEKSLTDSIGANPPQSNNNNGGNGAGSSSAEDHYEVIDEDMKDKTADASKGSSKKKRYDWRDSRRGAGEAITTVLKTPPPWNGERPVIWEIKNHNFLTSQRYGSSFLNHHRSAEHFSDSFSQILYSSLVLFAGPAVHDA